jgi:hypothetical protein
MLGTEPPIVSPPALVKIADTGDVTQWLPLGEASVAPDSTTVQEGKWSAKLVVRVPADANAHWVGGVMLTTEPREAAEVSFWLWPEDMAFLVVDAVAADDKSVRFHHIAQPPDVEVRRWNHVVFDLGQRRQVDQVVLFFQPAILGITPQPGEAYTWYIDDVRLR